MDKIEEIKQYIRNNNSLPHRKVNFELKKWMVVAFRKIYNNNQKDDIKNALEELRNSDEFSKYFLVDVQAKREELNRLMTFIDNNNRKPTNKSDNRDELKLCKIWRRFRDSRELFLYTNRIEVDNMFKDFMNNPKYNIYYLRSVEKWLPNLEKLKTYITENKKLPETGKLKFWYTYQKRRCGKRDLTYIPEIIELWNEFKNSELHKSVL